MRHIIQMNVTADLAEILLLLVAAARLWVLEHTQDVDPHRVVERRAPVVRERRDEVAPAAAPRVRHEPSVQGAEREAKRNVPDSATGTAETYLARGSENAVQRRPNRAASARDEIHGGGPPEEKHSTPSEPRGVETPSGGATRPWRGE